MVGLSLVSELLHVLLQFGGSDQMLKSAFMPEADISLVERL